MVVFDSKMVANGGGEQREKSPENGIALPDIESIEQTLGKFS